MAGWSWWGVADSNHRRRKPTDLQSAPFDRSGNPPRTIPERSKLQAKNWRVKRIRRLGRLTTGRPEAIIAAIREAQIYA